MTRTLAIIASILLAAPTVAWAQNNPSADQIIRALTPPPSPPPSVATPAPTPNSSISSAAAPTHPTPSAPPAMTAVPAKPASAATTAAASPPKTSAPSVNLSIDFAASSSQLTPQAVAALDELGKALKSPALAAFEFRIVGHTDTVGNPQFNKTLSLERATAVKNYLVRKYRIASARLEASGVGEADLLVPTPPNTPEPRNRRVQIVNLGK